MPDNNERLATLEEQHRASLIRDTERDEKLDTVVLSVNRIETKMARMGGFFAGVTFAFGIIGAGVAAGFDLIYQKFTHG